MAKPELEQMEEFQERMRQMEQDYNRLRAAGAAADQEQLRNIEERIRATQTEIAQIEQNREARRGAINELQEQIENLERANQTERDSNRRAERQNEILEARRELLERQIQDAEMTNTLETDQLELLEQQLDATNQQIEQNERLNQQQIRRNQLLNDTLKITNLITGGLSGQFLQFSTMEGKLPIGLLEEWSRLVKEVISSNEELVHSTGQIGLTSGMAFSESAMGLAAYGKGYAELAKTTGQLFNTMTTFSNLDKQTRIGLAESATKMENLGIAASQYGSTLNELTHVFKMTAGEADKTVQEIARMGQGIGVAPAKALKDFNSVMPQIAANGLKAKQVFFELEKQSKALGIEMNNLVGIAMKFDTFESAAENAGKLNAILGGDYLNSVEMLNATEEERIQMMRDSFAASGQSFETMDRFKQKSIAMALGLKDAGEAAKLFGTMSAQDEAAMRAEAAAQEKLEEAQKAAAKTTDQLKQALSALLIAVEPLARGLKWLVTAFSELPGPVRLIIALLPLIAKGIYGLIFGFKQAGDSAKEGSKGFADGIRNVGRAAAESAEGLLALGAAALMIGGGIAIAAYGLSELVKSFNGLGDAAKPAAYALGIFTVAFLGLMLALALMVTGPQAAIAAGAVGLLLSVGVAALMIGGGIAAAAYGLSLFVKELIKAKEAIEPVVKILSDAFVRSLTVVKESIALIVNADADKIVKLGDALFGVAKGLTAIAAAGVATSVSGFFGGSDQLNMLKRLGEIVDKFPVEKITTLSDKLKDISDSLSKTFEDSLFVQLEKIVSLIKELPDTFDIKINSVKELITTVDMAANAGEKLTPAKDFIVAAKEYYIAQKESKTPDNDALVAALKTVVGTGNTTGGVKAGTPVIIKIENGPDLRGYVLGTPASTY